MCINSIMHLTLFLTTGFQLAATVLLIVPSISATLSPSPLSRRGSFRDYAGQQRDTLLPPGWALQSCYTDNTKRPTLTSISYEDDKMTVRLCVNTCNNYYLNYAGLENGSQCYCGNVTTAGSTNAPDDDCKTHCIGDLTEFCGGPNSLSLYGKGSPPQPNPVLVEVVGTWSYTGCYSDSNDARTLAVPSNISYIHRDFTVENCLDNCDNLGGYAFAGVEFAVECWCGSSINSSSTRIDRDLCSVLACSGNSLEYCGASHSMIIYNRGRY